MRPKARGWFSTLAVLVLLVAGIAVQGAVRSAAGVERSSAARASGIHVFPVPGTTTVSPGAQISFRGSGTSAIQDLKVVGSSSGAHSGHWLVHSDGQGRSFVPDKPFSAGEAVTVTTSADIAGVAGGSFSYRVAVPAAVTPGQAAASSPALNSSAATPQATAALATAPQATAAATAPPAPTGEAGPFRSRPDLHPPAIATTSSGTQAPGLLFTTVLANPGSSQPSGSEIFDDTGQPVWFQPGSSPTWLHPITYQGKPALVYYSGVQSSVGFSNGEWIVLDTSYRQVATIQTNNGYAADLHELQISPDGTKAVMDIYNPVQLDMSAYGGSADATVYEGVIQEIDLATGAVTFEWHSLAPGNIPVTDSYMSLSTPGLDYMHLNSVEYDSDGNFLFTGRHISAIGKIDRATGALMWLFGGKRNQFTFTDGDGGPSWPHDVRRRPDGTISVFDNGVGRNPPYSRAVVWQVDETAKTAHVAEQWRETPDLYGDITGNTTLLPNGDDFVSWGNTGRSIEYQGQTPVFESQMATGTFPYRTVRVDGWHATPARPPDMALDRSATGVAAYASWNGATDVASWQLWGGTDWSHLRPLASAPRTGFETVMLAAAQPTDGVFQVRALDASGNTLGISGNVADPITAKYQALGGSNSFLGASTSGGEYAVGSGLAEDFAGGTIYWSASSGAHEVHGAIDAKYRALGGPTNFLGFPTTDQTGASDGRGQSNNFQGGAIYWTSATGAHEVHGEFGFVWTVSGAGTSVLGYPSTDQQTAADGVGQDQWFETGALYSSPSTGTHEVHSGIVLVWASMGAEQGSFGYPISNTITLSDGTLVSFFQHGWIQWFPSDNHATSGTY